MGCFHCPHTQLPVISQAVYSLSKLQYHWDFFKTSFLPLAEISLDSALGITGRVLVAGLQG